jgi:hypothetical protein
MNDMSDLDAIEPGMPVTGIDGEMIGMVESVHPASIRVADHEIPRAAIAEVTERGVTLRLAKTALMSRRDPEVEGSAAASTMPDVEEPQDGRSTADRARREAGRG